MNRVLSLAAFLLVLPIGCAHRAESEPNIGAVPPLYQNESQYDSPLPKDQAVAPIPEASAGVADLLDQNGTVLVPGTQPALDPGAPYSSPDLSPQNYYDSYPYTGNPSSVDPYVYGYPYSYSDPNGRWYDYQLDPSPAWAYRNDYYRPYDRYYRYDGRYLPNDRWRRGDDVHVPGDRNRPIPPRDDKQYNRDPRTDRSPREPYRPGERRNYVRGPVRDAGQVREQLQQREDANRRAADAEKSNRRSVEDANAKQEADRSRQERESRQRENQESLKTKERSESRQRDSNRSGSRGSDRPRDDKPRENRSGKGR